MPLSPRVIEALTILASLPDPPPISLRPQYASMLTFAIMSQVAIAGAMQTMLAKKARPAPKKRIKRPRRLVLNFGKGHGSVVMTFDEGDPGDGGVVDPGDSGTGEADSGESTAGTQVDVDPPSDGDSSALGGLADAVSAAADALGQAIGEIDVGETADEIYNALMNEGAM
jgi:hypothetical protein